MSLLTLTPTFTQGFILGQISILVLLGYVLRYLFFDASSPKLVTEGVEEREQDVPTESSTRFSIKAQPLSPPPSQVTSHFSVLDYVRRLQNSSESLEWFNFLLVNVRSHLVQVPYVKRATNVPLPIDCPVVSGDPP